jgi:hypothetical protein
MLDWYCMFRIPCLFIKESAQQEPLNHVILKGQGLVSSPDKDAFSWSLILTFSPTGREIPS